jgi:NAD(P)-dependent dehydrogenase (short-subunit alcohol dehydrogenase family)
MPSILITGVSTGIGRASAELFRDRGWTVIGTVRDPSCPEGAACPEGVSLEALDLALPGSSTALAEIVLARHGCPDVVLNNAGILQFGPLEAISAEELERLYRVNVFSQMELVRALLPAMRERGSGTIANVTSLGGRLVFPFFAGYNSTKWALEAISEGLWHELQPFGIRVKSIEPGFVETAIWSKALPQEGEGVEGPKAYRGYLESMARFESSIKNRTSPEKSAEEIFSAVTDPSDRLRYPVAAYARPMVAARRWFGDQRFIRFFHGRWMPEPRA